MFVSATGRIARGTSGHFEADAPSGLTIAGFIASSVDAYRVNASGAQYGGGFYWSGGGSQINASTVQTGSSGLNSSFLGFQLVCGVSPCTDSAQISVGTVALDARETTPPDFAGQSGLWQTTGWVRGSWPLSAWSNSPSGVCQLTASLNGQLVAETTSNPNGSLWHQCAEAPIDATVDTTRYGDGAIPLTLAATDAAQLTGTATHDINVDNVAPTVALSGPTDAPFTAGTQYVTATTTAGKSGIASIACSVDGGPAGIYQTSTAQVPVTGLGEHTVSCTAQNNAVDGNGVHGTSAPATTTVKIGTPTVAAIGFTSLVDGLRCHKVTETVRIPARWVTVLVKGRKVRVHERAHTQRIRVTKCRVRTARRTITVWVKVRRHGRTVRVRRRKTVRVLLRPHRISRTTRLVAHGRGTTVDGWVGTTTGVALASQPVQLYAAVADGSNQFVPVGTTTTRANGSWSARIGAGPSRLIKAVYPGEPTTESAESAPVTMVVPARVRLLRVSPARVPWGGTVRLTGRLVGGYLPPGGALVRLRIGLGRTFITYGVHEHVTGSGRFTTSYTFGAGQASVYRAYSFQLASLPMGNYPYAPAASNRLQVVVGGHPAPRRRPSRRTHRRG